MPIDIFQGNHENIVEVSIEKNWEKKESSMLSVQNNRAAIDI